MHKKLIGTIALGLIVGATTININANPKLNDINGHWANKEIQDFISKGYINGYDDKTFKPDNSITRAEFVRIANNYFGFKNKGNENFPDVNSSDWFYNDVCIALEEGYINGYDDGTFKPNKTITREEAAKIIISIEDREDLNIDKLNNFSDGNTVSNWAKKYVEGAIEAGYIKGDNNGKINPVSNITRAESVSMISRVIKEVHNEPPKINAQNVTLEYGQAFDKAMAHFSAEDCTGKDITFLVTMSGNVNVHQAGTYKVTFSVKDQFGLTANKTIDVLVKAQVAQGWNVTSPEFHQAVADRLNAKVNAYAVSQGHKAMAIDGGLNSVAQSWSNKMANERFCDHTAPDGSGSNDGMIGSVYILGENVATAGVAKETGLTKADADKLADRLYTLWYNSGGHRGQWVSDNKFMGFAFASNGTSIYATQEFGSEDFNWGPSLW